VLLFSSTVYPLKFDRGVWVFKNARGAVNSTCPVPFKSMCIIQNTELSNSATRRSLPFKPMLASNINGSGAFMYVLTGSGSLLVSKTDHMTLVHTCSSNTAFRLTHPCLVPDGEDLLGAGQLWVRDNKILIIDNFSGHYMPPDDSLNQVELAVTSHGLKGATPPFRLAWYREMALRSLVQKAGRVDEESLQRAERALYEIDLVKAKASRIGGMASRFAPPQVMKPPHRQR
jgi:hypothetical protein